MTTTLSRRGLLHVLTGAAATTAAFLYPDITTTAKAATNRRIVDPTQDGPDPTYAGGEVTSIDGNNFVLQTPASSQTVVIPSDAAVWKEFELGPDAIDPGDWLDVQGAPQVDGTLLATSGMVFANIGRADGTIVTITDQEITLDSGTNLTYSSSLEVIDSDTMEPLPGGLSALSSGMAIGAVGLMLGVGALRATRIWI
jgi:hypothetical protein